VQHREGGVVGALMVKEGQHVTKDQVLLQLAGADVQAQERSLSAAVIGLKAQRARLVAEQLGTPIVWPPEFATLTGEDLAEAQRAMATQSNQFRARASTLSTQGGVLGQRNLQLQEQISGYEKQIASIDEQSRLLTEEVAGMRTLNEKGFAPMTKVRELERALAQLGVRGRPSAPTSPPRASGWARPGCRTSS
jgi:HlyD family secretion protein